ncbi:MAG: nucleotidyltransferase domain-containing protein [Candidatus Eisenbacteria bacterium]
MKPDHTPSRDKIVRTIVAALEPLDYVYALWEGGAVAFGRVDEWSDIDICVDADDERVTDTFPVVEGALESLAPIEHKYDVPEPALGEYVQAFYRLKGTPEFMLIDFAVFKHSAEDKLLQPEIHGSSLFHFNKANLLTCPALDREKLSGKLRDRVRQIQKRLETFGCFVEKELNRHNDIEALDLYHRLILGSLVEVLRIKHKPVRHDFKTRYVHYDLPPDLVARLADLYFVKDADDIRSKSGIARTWLEEVMSNIDFKEIAKGPDNRR